MTESQAVREAEDRSTDWLFDEGLGFPQGGIERERPPGRSRPTGKASFESPVRFLPQSSNRKLSPVDARYVGGGRLAITPRAPYCSSTYASIEATCPSSCALKGKGCYAQTGMTRFVVDRMDQAAVGKAALEVVRAEVEAIDGAFGGGAVPQDGYRGRGRDLRLHVAGEVSCAKGAGLLGGAAVRWSQRGGGRVWTYTHRWREIDRDAWGAVGAPGVAVLASVERPREIDEAAARGYAAAIVVGHFPGDRAFRLEGSALKVVPCPAETRGTTCVECRLCMDDARLLAVGRAIGFSVHGSLAQRVRRRLDVLNGRGQMSLL